jgi:hypothetical protein
VSHDEESAAPQAVRISSTAGQLAGIAPLLASAKASAGDVPALLALAREAGSAAPRPGEGATAFLWEILASVTAVDVAAGRVLEPHLDALAILAQVRDTETGAAAPAAGSAAGRTWGVFAAEAAGMRLEAKADPRADGGFVLHGSKPWCSLAAQLDGAVLTAHVEGQGPGGRPARRAFAVDLRDPGVTCEVPEWTSRGLREIPSGTVTFDGVPAVPVGEPGWYFERPGFAWGGMGVAACWLGGAVALARDFRSALAKSAAGGREPDQIALAHLGETDRILASLTQYLARTAARIDAGGLTGSGAWSEALRVRGSVAAAVERIQTLVSQNLGPGPLAFNDAYGKRMADLSLYIRQHHAMRDDAQLGALVLKGDRGW